MIHNEPWQNAQGKYDLIIADPPYGVLTAAKWDQAPDMKEVFDAWWPFLDHEGVIVVTATMPFSSSVVSASPEAFRYALVWDKCRSIGHLNSKKRPMVSHEDILVFSKAPLGRHTYNPQYTKGKPYKGRRAATVDTGCYGKHGPVRYDNPGRRHPRSILPIEGRGPAWHPTAKPVELMQWLVRTYSNEGDRVLEPYGGSCPVHQACIIENRHCDSYELSKEYWQKATEAQAQKELAV